MTAPNRQNGRSMAEWRRMCLTKRRYSDEVTARAGGFRLFEARARGERTHLAPKVTQLFVYQCVGCRGWHLTRKKTELPPITCESVLDTSEKRQTIRYSVATAR